MSPWEPIGTDPARELARRELQQPIYRRDTPSILERVLDRVGDWLNELFNRIPQPGQGNSTGGRVAVVFIIVALVVAGALVLRTMRDRRNAESQRHALLDTAPSTAQGHRAEAARHAANGDWAPAIRERLRAIARDLEQRDIVDPRPGRTAHELATQAALALPAIAERFHAGVRVFNDVWYGGRPGTREGYEQLTALDELTRSAERTAPQSTGPAVDPSSPRSSA